MRLLEKIALLILGIVFTGLTWWLQYGLLSESEPVVETGHTDEPDYYVENFSARGMNDKGQLKYILEGDRLVHYPDDDTALVDNPHIVQYLPGSTKPTHIYSETGWLTPGGEEIHLTGKVRVVEGKTATDPGRTQYAKKMRVRLKQPITSKKKNRG